MFTRTIRPGLVILALLLSLVALGPAAGNSLWTEQFKLTSSDGGAFDRFGTSVALSGNTALVGSYLDDVGNNFDAGSAYMYHWDGSQWVEQAKLTASDGAAFDYFGFSVALSGHTALVGALSHDAGGTINAGSAYVYRWDGETWAEQAKLIASDGEPTDQFGLSVALSGNTALVGANQDNVGGIINSGSAYVYRWDGETWVEQAKLTASDGQAGDGFGVSAALSGNTALVGAWNDDVGDNSDAGSAYVYRWDGDTWVEQAQLTASDGEASDFFGESLALRGNTALVGAYLDDVGGVTDVGSAYVYRWDGSQWVEQAKLIASDGAASDWFGVSAALKWNTALVGASGLANISSTAGSAYVFGWDGSQWVEQAKLAAGDGEVDDMFGISAALSGNTALVGASVDDVGGNADAGSVYMFRLEP